MSNAQNDYANLIGMQMTPVQMVDEITALRAALDQERADNAKLRAAAKVADWEQVRLNGGPPCFHIEDGRFCLRAERWVGHPTYHKFVTLHGALLSGRGERDSALGSAAGRER